MPEWSEERELLLKEVWGGLKGRWGREREGERRRNNEQAGRL